MPARRIDRRTFTATGAGFAAGVLALPFVARGASAQEATPAAAVPVLGFVSTRLRTLPSAAARETINGMVLDTFAPDVAALPGYEGYLLGDVADQDNQSLTVVVLDEESQAAGFDELAATFVAGFEPDLAVTATMQWAGDLLIGSGPYPSAATPAATPALAATPVAGGAQGYVAMRVHTSIPGTDPRDFVPLATEGFLPIVAGLPGFEGYLWYPTEGGFVAISVFDSEAAAQESNAAAKDWAAEFLTEYTDGNPQIINANIVYADMPIFAKA